MAIWKTVRIMNHNGEESQRFTSGLTSNLELSQVGNSICVKKESIFAIKEETTCVHQPHAIIENNNSRN